MKMTIEEYAKTLAEAVNEKLGSNHIVNVKTIDKGNGLILTGLNVILEGRQINPLIYIDKYYEHDININSAANMVIGELDNIRKSEELEPIAKQFYDWDWAKSRIIFEIVGKETNADRPKEIMHIDWLDLSIVFMLRLDKDDDGEYTVNITSQLAAYWGKTVDELYKAALINTPALRRIRIGTFFEMMSGIFEELQLTEEEKREINESNPFYIITNTQGTGGAACILYPGILKNVKRAIGNFILLPSSKHEVLIVPSPETPDTKSINDFKSIVSFVNENDVSQLDKLTDSVYYYSDKLRKIA